MTIERKIKQEPKRKSQQTAPASSTRVPPPPSSMLAVVGLEGLPPPKENKSASKPKSTEIDPLLNNVFDPNNPKAAEAFD